MDVARVEALREVLASTGWLERTREFGRVLRTSTRRPGRLLLVGTPREEPWHLAAHLDDEARWRNLPEIAPTLVRWSPPADAPPHLRVGLDRIARAGRGQTLFVVAADDVPVPLLERVSDARRVGATVLALDGGDAELEAVAHDAIAVPPHEHAITFDTLQHLVSAAAGEPAAPRPGLRDRMARLLDNLSGPQG